MEKKKQKAMNRKKEINGRYKIKIKKTNKIDLIILIALIDLNKSQCLNG